MRAGAKRRPPVNMLRWLAYYFGRLLQVTGLLVTLIAATQFFGTRHMTAMLRMMLIGVVIFIPGWLIARRDPQRNE
jgi:hypothetical protein